MTALWSPEERTGGFGACNENSLKEKDRGGMEEIGELAVRVRLPVHPLIPGSIFPHVRPEGRWV